MRMGTDLNDPSAFYTLYLRMRTQKGLLPQPFSFFRSVWEKLIERNQGDLYLAEYEGRTVAALLILIYNRLASYEYGATDVSRLSLAPSHFLLWEAIQRSRRQGCIRFDFGRTSSDNKGLLLFKSR
jgi:lipid II:glycine glycyltransferase (peptidoglycan interpeptide bridge formation enzyme)